MAVFIAVGPAPAASPDEAARKFIDDHEARVRPLEKASGLAWWNANISGKDEDFQAKEEAQNRLDAALTDRERFAALKAIREGLSGAPAADPLINRQIEVLYLQY